MKFKNINIFTDGGARGNPGPSAIGVYVTEEEKIVYAKGEKAGVGTNNEAEYKAVLKALAWLDENKDKIEKNTNINFYIDSQLIYSQITGIFKVKNPNMRSFIFKIREIEAGIEGKIFYNHIPREKNKKADELVNLALDNII